MYFCVLSMYCRIFVLAQLYLMFRIDQEGKKEKKIAYTKTHTIKPSFSFMNYFLNS